MDDFKGLPAQSQGCRGMGNTGYSWPDHLLLAQTSQKRTKAQQGQSN